jgi:hypothetical protein
MKCVYNILIIIIIIIFVLILIRDKILDDENKIIFESFRGGMGSGMNSRIDSGSNYPLNHSNFNKNIKNPSYNHFNQSRRGPYHNSFNEKHHNHNYYRPYPMFYRMPYFLMNDNSYYNNIDNTNYITNIEES